MYKGVLNKSRFWRMAAFAAVLVFMMGCALVNTGSENPAMAADKAVKSDASPGSFSVVGMGPGDADLMTVRALDAIKKADLVFCGEKTREKLAAYVNFDGKEVKDGYQVLFRYYGKDCADAKTKTYSRARMSCEEYHKQQEAFIGLVRAAVTDGRHVVILSGGDPTIYGPDIWSLNALSDLNPLIIPGLSAFNAANAALKVMLGEVVITAPMERKNSEDTIEKLSANEMTTMVIFMPRDMTALFTRLSACYPPQTPVAVISNAGMKGMETVVSGTVQTFAKDTSGLDAGRSIVYVGKGLKEDRFKVKEPASEKNGKFYLVGMGPGDADLATLRALKVIEEADVIFAHKRLSEKFKEALAGKEVINGYHRLFPFYGKSCVEISEEEKKSERMSCEEYHEKQEAFSNIARKAMAEGKTVAMLDSGDPMVYGPCAWSLLELSDLETEVVPGVSCFNAANAALRAGVTESRTAHSIILASGWTVEKMAAHQSTMVLFTMRHDFKNFIDSLSKHYPPETPIAIVESAGYAAKENVRHGTLGTIMETTGENNLPFEYLLYVGDFLEKSVDRNMEAQLTF